MSGIKAGQEMASIPDYIQFLESYVERSGARLVRSSLPDDVHGSVSRNVITLRRGLAPEQELATLVHEIAHWLAHRGAMSRTLRTVFEYEAEAVEALVMAQLGIPSAAFDDSPTDDLLSASVTRVNWVSARICAALGVGGEPARLKP